MKLSRLFILFGLSALLFGGCNQNQSDKQEEEQKQQIPDQPSQDEQPKVYEKDGEGFFILEDDYFSYKENTSDTKTKNEVFIPKDESSVHKYSQLRMYIGDKQVPVYNVKTNMSQTWAGDAPSRQNNSYATIGLKGKVTIKLQANFSFLNEVAIRPSNKNVPFTIDANRRVLSFTISDVGQYTIEMRSKRTLHFFVEDISRMTNSDNSVMYFGPGIHKHSNDSRIGSNNVVNLSSNQKVFIAPGAFIYGKFMANNASNIQITGPGYIDGSVFERDANKGSVLVPIEFNNCSNITLKDFACVDPAGWCFNMYFCNGVVIDNVKVISSRSNGDGISLQSCQNVDVTNSFVRSWDDSLVVKNYPQWSNRDIEGVTRHITFTNCILWTDLAQSMEIGYETVGQIMEDITFNNIVVLHNYHKAVISIHNANNANLTDVHFKNITIEDASMGKGDGNPYLVDLRNLFNATWSTNHKITTLGSVDGVEIKNVRVIKGIQSPVIIVKGAQETRDGFVHDNHYVRNVTFTDFYLYDRVIDKETCNYQTNELTSNINFVNTGNEITGASYTPKDVNGYGENITFLE